LMLGSFAFAAGVLNEPRYLKAAKRSADFILTHLKSKNRLLHSWRQGQSHILATLEDYAFLINGILDLYEVSLEECYFNEAKTLAQEMVALFEDSQGGFFLTGKDAPELIVRPKEIYDGAMPSGNSVAAYLLTRLYLMTSEAKWFDYSEKIFKTFGASLEQSPSAYTYALSAFDFYQGPSLNVILEGKEDDDVLTQMKTIIFKHYMPNKSLLFRSANSLASAYVCRGNTCHKPTQELNVLESQLLE
jgi:uncharacterized protein YyaL (SSP411 family)